MFHVLCGHVSCNDEHHYHVSRQCFGSRQIVFGLRRCHLAELPIASPAESVRDSSHSGACAYWACLSAAGATVACEVRARSAPMLQGWGSQGERRRASGHADAPQEKGTEKGGVAPPHPTLEFTSCVPSCRESMNSPHFCTFNCCVARARLACEFSLGWLRRNAAAAYGAAGHAGGR